MKTAGIYFHIPFCKNKCNYCDYYSLEKREKDIPGFVEMLMREIELSAHEYGKNCLSGNDACEYVMFHTMKYT